MSMFEDWFGQGTGADLATLGVFVAAAASAYALVRLLLPVAHRAAQRSKFLWDDILAYRRLRHRLALVAPAALVYVGARVVADEASEWRGVVLRLSGAVLVVVATATVAALLHAGNAVYERRPVSRDRPIEPYVQVAVIVTYLFGAVFAIAMLADRSPWFFVSGLGALTAVLLLVFKDTILSLVASLQLASGDLVDVGDWIEVPEYGADGTVVDVALHTVTVQNFDKTLTTVPTCRLVSGSFRNWRGMAQSGRRRIKRSIYIDLATIRFLTADELARFSEFGPLREYMARKTAELTADHERRGDPDDPRRLTNIGTLRAYIDAYLRGLDTVDTKDMMFLVRQLQPGPSGLPLEIYVFAATTEWPEYEAIQADIFDHILAMVPEFGLRLFQDPTGQDVRSQDGPAGEAARELVARAPLGGEARSR